MSAALEKIFDFICAERDADGDNFSWEIKTKEGKNKKIIVTPKISTNYKTKALQAFIHNVVQKETEERKIQAFEGSSSLPQLTKDVFNVTMAVPEYDLLWQNSYRGIKLMKGQLNWEITDVSSGVAFKLIPEGGKVEYRELTGAVAIVGIDKYGAALGITWETIEGRKLYRFVEQMEDARSKLFGLWGNVHYNLLYLASLSNLITWQGVVADRQIDRDIATINKGTADCGRLNKDKGYGDTANNRFLLYADPDLRPRIMAALRATSIDVTQFGPRGITIDAKVNPYFTYNDAILDNKALLVLPGQKIQNAVYLKELGLSKKDIETLNELRTYWTAFGAAIGDTDQVFELSFA